jgi:hypothetical protein
MGARCTRWARSRARIALDVKVILTPPCTLFSLVILYTKYTGLRQKDFNVYAY